MAERTNEQIGIVWKHYRKAAVAYMMAGVFGFVILIGVGQYAVG